MSPRIGPLAPYTVIASVGILYALSSQALSSYYLTLGALSILFAGLASVYDFFYTRSGYLNLGYTFIMGVTGYTMAIFLRELPPSAAIPLGILFSALPGLLIALPALRLRGPFYSVATMVFPFILLLIARLFPDTFGGDVGLYVAPLAGLRELFYASVATSTATALALAVLGGARFGKMVTAVSDDEILLESLGFRTWALKILLNALAIVLTAPLMLLFIQVQGIMRPEVVDPIPLMIYILLASGIYRPGRVVGAYASGPLIYLADSFLRSSFYDIRLLVVSSLVASIYMARGVGLARAKIG